MASCDACGEPDPLVLTKHHYTRKERHLLKIKGGADWTWRCANCHMRFNRLGTKKFYEWLRKRQA